MKQITLRQANQQFSRIVREIEESGETILVTRNGKPAIKLSPVEECAPKLSRAQAEAKARLTSPESRFSTPDDWTFNREEIYDETILRHGVVRKSQLYADKKDAGLADRVTLDSNVLVYAFDNTEPLKQPIAMQLLWLAQERNAILTTTALGEFYWVMVRKAKVTPLKAHGLLRDLITLFPVAGFGTDALEAAAFAAAGGRFGFWDAVLLATAEDAGCTICFSEDMQDGARSGDIVVCNPFGETGLSAAAREALGV